MTSCPLVATLWLALACGSAASDDDKGRAVIKQDISIKAPSANLALPLPPPGADPAVVNEVVGSLTIMTQAHAAKAASVQVPGAERLARPYPEAPYLVFSPRSVTAPYDLWTFEIVEAPDTVLMRQDGTGRVASAIEWDGSGPSGEDAVRVGKTYFFRFTGRRGSEAFALTSEAVELKSLALREMLGNTRLEVANDRLFSSGSSKLKPEGAADYLRPMAERMRRMAPKDAYKVDLYAAKPQSELARQRSDALRRWLADALLINASRVQVTTLTIGARGDVTACPLPADRGETIRIE